MRPAARPRNGDDVVGAVAGHVASRHADAAAEPGAIGVDGAGEAAVLVVNLDERRPADVLTDREEVIRRGHDSIGERLEVHASPGAVSGALGLSEIRTCKSSLPTSLLLRVGLLKGLVAILVSRLVDLGFKVLYLAITLMERSEPAEQWGRSA